MIRRVLLGFSLLALTALTVFGQQVGPTDDKNRSERLFSIATSLSGGYMGVGIRDVSSKNFQELGLTEVKGVAVTSVVKNSAAEKAGLTKGDVIVAIDGQRVTSSRKFRRMVREIAPDHTVNLTVSRGGSEIQIPLTMGSRKASAWVGDDGVELLSRVEGIAPRISVPRAPLPPEALISGDIERFSLRSSRAIGVGVTRLTDQLGEYFGVDKESGGVLINSVSKDGPAEKAGLRAGDVITKVNDKQIKGTFDLMRYLGKEGDVTITFVRDRAEQTVTVTPEKRDGSYFFFETRKNKENN